MQQTDFEKLLADTLAAHGRSPRTQETYTLMLRLCARYPGRDVLQRWPASGRDPRPLAERHRQHADDDSNRAGLSRYVHRIAIANSRITHHDGNRVTFRYKDRAHGNLTKHRTLSGADFARLFLHHVLPPRFVRIRHYGILAARSRGPLARCRKLLGAQPAAPRDKDPNWLVAFDPRPSPPILGPVAGVNNHDTSGNKQSKVLSRCPRPWFNSAYLQPLANYSVG